MSEARELFERFRDILMDRVKQAGAAGLDQEAARMAVIGASVREALDGEPPTSAAPDLPDYVSTDGESYAVMLADGEIIYLHQACATEDLDRIAEACRSVAARRRAGL